MRLILIVLVLSFSCSPSAWGTFSGVGVSDLSCGKYINEITTDPQAQNDYSWWLAGFITGVNLEKDREITTDSAALEAWLKQYCEKNPLDPFMRAAIELNKELDKKFTK